MNAVSETQDLSRAFEPTQAVRCLNFRIDRGEIFGLAGSDGAGKTTTIRVLLGVLKPTEGAAWALGYDVIREPQRLRQHIGYMSQKFSLLRDLTVEENLDFCSRIYRLRGRRLIERKAYALETGGVGGRKTFSSLRCGRGSDQRVS